MNLLAPVSPQVLSQGTCVWLDPSVELLEGAVSSGSLLCHGWLETGLYIPEGEGLNAFVFSLADAPVNVTRLRRDYSEDWLVNGMLSSLLEHGFAYQTGPEVPGAAELAGLRSECCRRRAQTRRRKVTIDLDASDASGRVKALWQVATVPPDITLLCRFLEDHTEVLQDLATRRRAAELPAHHVVVQTGAVASTAATRDAVLALGAAVVLEDVPWPAPEGDIPGLAELIAHRIDTHVVLTPDETILTDEGRNRCIAWARGNFISGVGLWLDPDRIWPGPGHPAQINYNQLFQAMCRIEGEIGDVIAVNMPGDEHLLGNLATDRPDPHQYPDWNQDPLRHAYVCWRIGKIKNMESACPWSQRPEFEEKWVRLADDLLPNNPDLLGLQPGSVIADVCGGMGRVARRLAPSIGADGMIVSIEMRRFLSERARKFACEAGLTMLQFRPGLAERLPLPDASVDAAVNEWTGAIWELGLGPAMVREMIRVVRPGGRIAVSHRLVKLQLGQLAAPWVQYDEIYSWVRRAVEHPDLTIVAERVWGQTVPSLKGENASNWTEQYMPRLLDPEDRLFTDAETEARGPGADVFLTLIAERRAT